MSSDVKNLCHFGFKSEQFWAIFGFKSEQKLAAVFK